MAASHVICIHTDPDAFVNSLLYVLCKNGEEACAVAAIEHNDDDDDDDVSYQWNDNAETALHAASKSV